MDITGITEALKSDGTPLVRSDFTSDTAWRTVVTEVSEPVDFDDPDNRDPGDGGYEPHITVVDDRRYEGVTGAALGRAFVETGDASGYVLLADSRTMSEAVVRGEITLDYVDLSVPDPEDAELFNPFMGRTFRCVMSEIASIEANLSIANMDFHEFADHTDPDGVFRGFEADE